ncbi:MAG: 50S ribosomal protein L15 [Opitutaceae bacterium]|jgi:large subunit ribosomal protein L15
MKLHELKNVPGAIHRKKRLGCGESSGHGKTCCKGGKGQIGRSGASIRPGFEGGQMPLYRKLPHRGFNQAAFRVEAAVVNVGDLEWLPKEVSEVNPVVLAKFGFIREGETLVKILGNGDLKRSLTISATKFSASAITKIEAAGGKTIVV